MSPRPCRDDRHPDLQTAIKETAWRQIATFGAPALSLRAIARELNISAPSIYNYYPSRDALVTALIVEAFNSLADTQEASLQNLPADDLSGRLSVLGLAYRQWAITYPQRYKLIFGTPIAHYHAPEEMTTPAANRALLPLMLVLQGIANAGKLRVDRLAFMPVKLKSMLSNWQKVADGFDLEVLYLTLIIWSRVHGLVLLEIGHQFPLFIDDPTQIFQREINNLINQYL
jgi:AcrR family transcriptional regulator